MTKEKIVSLTKYAQELKNRIGDATPIKHKNRATTYKAFLNNELRVVTAKLRAAKLAGN